jgi:dynein heavy chain
MVNNTVIDWFFPWPRSALVAVATHLLKNEDLQPSYVEGIIGHMVNVHQSVSKYSAKFQAELRRTNHTTPKHYLDYLACYSKQLTVARASNKTQYNRLDGGLKKLIDAGEAVEAYGEELVARKAIVDSKSKECNEMIIQIKQRQTEVETKKAQASENEKQLQEDNIRIAHEKKQAERALTEAEPALEAAANALNNLRKEDVSEVKSMPNPPQAVLAVCQCVLELKPTGNEDPALGWKAAKVMMRDPNFLQKLRTYAKTT